MWICKYCETKNNDGNTHCFLCGFLDDPVLKAASSDSEKKPERLSKIIMPVEDKKPEKPVVIPEPEIRPEETGRHEETAEDRKIIDIPVIHPTPDVEKYEDDRRLSLIARQNRKKQNRFKAAFAVINILLAAANAAICYFVFK